MKFQAWRASLAVTLALEHTPGDQLFVDYAGNAVPFVDPKTGLEQRAWLFVAVWRRQDRMSESCCFFIMQSYEGPSSGWR